MSVLIKQPGFLSMVMDSGRYGWQRYGISPSGAIDPWSFMVGNMLVGNERNMPALEATVRGPLFEVSEECLVAVTGAQTPVRLNGVEVPQWQVLYLKPGDTLEVGLVEKGMRVYVAFAGGIVAEEYFGSASASLPNGIGRRLRQEDQLLIGKWDRLRLGLIGRRVREGVSWEDTSIIRVTKGPQWYWFSDVSLESFLSGVYRVDSNSDRMALRLSGKELFLKKQGNLLSEGNVWGGIQVPGSGLPIALLADRQTVGGYPKIAIIAGVDLPKAGQLRPGDMVSFVLIAESEAEALWQEYLYGLNHIRAYWD